MNTLRWIPVSERLPIDELREYRSLFTDCDEGIEVIVLIEGALIPTALYFDGDGFYADDGSIYDVSYWMSFPPRPDECYIDVDLGDDFKPNREMLEFLVISG